MSTRMLPDLWTPEVWSHTAVLNMAARLDPGAIVRHADQWRAEIDAATAVFDDLWRRLGDRLAVAWRGAGADASLDAVRNYAAGSLDGLVRCHSVADGLVELARAAGDLKGALVGEADHDGALGHVRELYSRPAIAAGNAVGEIPPPPTPFGPPAGADGWLLPGVGPPDPATASPMADAAVTTPAGMGGGPLPLSGALHAGLPDAMADRAPPDATARPPVLPTGIAGSVVNLPYDRGPASSGVAPGGAVDGKQAPGAVAGAATAVTASAPGTVAHRTGLPSTPYLGPLYPGHGGRDGGETRVAGYLISIDSGSELIGPLPLVAPPVIGE